MHEFLSTTRWKNAKHHPLAGDASARKYVRLTSGSESAIVMDAGIDAADEINRFKTIAEYLHSLGLSAPEILATDATRYMLLEDLGDAVFSSVIAANPALEAKLYLRAADALAQMHRSSTPDTIKRFGPTEMTTAVEILFDWYPRFSGQTVSDPQKWNFLNILNGALSQHLTSAPVFIHRDYHAENLIWLPERDAYRAVGLLDFQDAVSGDPAYDLASLLYDARRDVPPEIREQTIDHFTAETSSDPIAFRTAFALCAAQRNLRILGIFTRLSVLSGKRSYADLMPRVWRDLNDALQHLDLSEIRSLFQELFTPPTSEIIARIKASNDL